MAGGAGNRTAGSLHLLNICSWLIRGDPLCRQLVEKRLSFHPDIAACAAIPAALASPVKAPLEETE